MFAMSAATVPRKMPNRPACHKQPLPMILPFHLSQHAVFRGARMQPASSKIGYTIGLSLDFSDPLLDDKREYAKKRLHLTEPVHFELTPGATPPEAMMGFLRLRDLEGMDALLLKPVFKDDVWNISKEPGSEENERAVCQRMAKEARDAVSRHRTTMEADLALLQGGTLKPGSQEEAAVQARVKELQTLDHIAQWFKQRAAQLSTLDYYQKRWHDRLVKIPPIVPWMDPWFDQRNRTFLVFVSVFGLSAVAICVFCCSTRFRWVSGLLGGLACAIGISFVRYLQNWDPIYLGRWLQLLVARKRNRQFDLFVKDAVVKFGSQALHLSNQSALYKSKAVLWVITAVPLIVALHAICMLTRETEFIWKAARFSLGYLELSSLAAIVSYSYSAMCMQIPVRKQQLQLALARDAADPSHPLPGPVKVGFLDTGLSVPMLRYIFKFCK